MSFTRNLIFEVFTLSGIILHDVGGRAPHGLHEPRYENFEDKHCSITVARVVQFNT